MDKKLAVGGGSIFAMALMGYLYYRNRQKKMYDATKTYVLSGINSQLASKVAQQALTPAQQVSIGALGTSQLQGQADILLNEETNVLSQQQRLEQAIPEQTAVPDSVKVADQSAQVAKLINTINSNILTQDELNTVADLFRINDNTYVGTETRSQVMTNAQTVFTKYGINIH